MAFDLGLLDGSCFNLCHAVIPLFGHQREARRLVVVIIVGRVLQYRHADDLHFDEAPGSWEIVDVLRVMILQLSVSLSLLPLTRIIIDFRIT